MTPRYYLVLQAEIIHEGESAAAALAAFYAAWNRGDGPSIVTYGRRCAPSYDAERSGVGLRSGTAMPLILCARVSWPVPAVRGLTEARGVGVQPPPLRVSVSPRALTETVARKGGASDAAEGTARRERIGLSPVSVSPWRCSWCGARVKVVA